MNASRTRLVRRMRHAQRRRGGCDVGLEILEEVRKDIEIVPAAVRIADSERVDAETGQIERTDGVVEVEPAEFVGEVAVERLRVQRLAGHPDLRRTAEVAERIARGRRGVVVRAVDEHPGDAAKRVERGAESAESMLVAEVVARVHDEVGPPGLRKRRHPPLLAMLPGGHVRVGEVEHAHGRGAGRQDAHVVLTDREQIALDADAPDRSARADRPHRSESGEGGLGVRVRH